MTTICVFSDSHNIPFPQRVLSVMEESNRIFFCGDGIADVLCELTGNGIDKKLSAIPGNCDGKSGLPEEITVEIEKRKFLIVHGHRYKNSSPELLAYRAEELGCDTVVCGHTHVAEITECGAVTIINCGSLSLPRFGGRTYAYLVVNGKDLFPKIVNIG